MAMMRTTGMPLVEVCAAVGWSSLATFTRTFRRIVGIVVPDEVVAAFGRGKRVPVVVTIDGQYRYRNTIASMGGRFLISFNRATTPCAVDVDGPAASPSPARSRASGDRSQARRSLTAWMRSKSASGWSSYGSMRIGCRPAPRAAAMSIVTESPT